VSDWRVVQYFAQGSTFMLRSRFSAVRIVHRSGERAARSSCHAIGIDTVAPVRARVENAATEVLVRLFLR